MLTFFCQTTLFKEFQNCEKFSRAKLIFATNSVTSEEKLCHSNVAQHHVACVIIVVHLNVCCYKKNKATQKISEHQILVCARR